MRISRFIFPVLAVLALSACTSAETSENWDGVKSTWQDIQDWSHGKPSRTEEKIGRMPTGYYGQNRHNIDQYRKVVRPPVMTENTDWEMLEGYDEDFSDPGFDSNDSVSVFPLDGSEYPDGYAPIGMDSYGNMMQQVFFKHASAAIAMEDKQALQSLAQSMGPEDSPLLTIVGHASKRVYGVDDPMQRKLINFRMAQKRADAVTRALGNAGLNPSWIVAVSKGDEEPNPMPGARDQESADRRVEVYMDNK